MTDERIIPTQKVESDASGKPEAEILNYYSLRKLYDKFIESFSVGENLLFANLPSEAVCVNYFYHGNERPFFHLLDASGDEKKWLTQADIDELKRKNKELVVPLDELLFDMFSLMFGGRSPSQEDLGIMQFVNLIPDQSLNSTTMQKVSRVLKFIDSNPKTNLTEWIHRQIGISFMHKAKYRTHVCGVKSAILVIGEASYPRGLLYIWHPIRNMRGRHFSPFREDGGASLSKAYDIQLGYETSLGNRITRINAQTFYMARHGICEDEVPTTESDQVYISLQEYAQHIFLSDPQLRERKHLTEEENMVIVNKLPGHEKIVAKRRIEAQEKLFSLADQGALDEWIRQIDEFEQHPEA